MSDSLLILPSRATVEKKALLLGNKFPLFIISINILQQKFNTSAP
ncbi:hypothetical protein ANACOL_03922 [Anaerotruncus colihominis DSM 17241]|uniref:Uncharacterized protein n=1 Tax=Anaerotruncus colihominis DSM 17241 TaxID=445972 RepID=B0PGQ4_9FIRM|nr:hypothetical protein ANACOL_03922 [Anaerotruncus colihominis DSM 17241]